MAKNKVLKAVYSISILTLGVTFIFGILWFIPKLQVDTYISSEYSQEKKEAIELENDTRRTWAQILGGAFFLLTAYFTWRRVTAAEKNVQISQEGQITERFTKAIDQIGDKEHLEVRLGGIYALERIARDSKKDHWTIMEVLSAYVRVNAPLRGKFEQANEKSMSEGKKSKESPKSSQSLTDISIPPADIQTILTVLGRRTLSHEKGEKRYLDLSDTDLSEINLFGANLDKVKFRRAKLNGANLNRANLSGTDFWEANLSRAYLVRAILSEAILSEAILREANLNETYLVRANLNGADLIKAHINSSILWEAELIEADLREAKLTTADLSGANFYKADLSGADFWVANLSRANLYEADLNGANLSEANLSGADLGRAINLTLEQLSNAKTLYEAILDPELQEEIKEIYPHLLKKPKKK